MKKILIIAFFCLISIGSLQAQYTDETRSYGITIDGDIFLKESLADECGASTNTIEVQGSFNHWNEMQNAVLIDKDHNLSTVEDGYYVLRTGKRYKKNHKIEISIKIGDKWFPECAKEKIAPSDLKINKDGTGNNLYVNPTDAIRFD